MMKSSFLKLGGLAAAMLMVASLAAGPAEARMGGSFGSRGMRTFSTPSITRIAPAPTAPIQRSMTPNSGPAAPGYSPGYQPGYGFNRGGFWPGFGGGLLGGMLGGLFFHGLFGSMLGYGFGGIGGGFSSIFQLLILGGLIWLAFRWFGGRRQAFGGNGFPFGGYGAGQPPYGSGGYGQGGGYGQPNPANRDEIGISNADLETFERMLGEVQAAYAREDHQGLRRLTTPEMVSYLSEELADNATHGLRNDVTDLKFLEGELAEAWREGNRDYATVAMHWSAIDVIRDRQTGEIKKGDPDHPVEGRELWTFVRENGGNWLLSAIQDAR
ncbi:MAG TPA: TIM44-like domain-containing protein [Devosia sp.]|nr:TIM44-like domain-containing protein [Devosia sp.]